MKYIITQRQYIILNESKEYLNHLLDKINDSGYDSLNQREKDALIRISQGEEVYDEPEKLPVSDEVYDPNRIFLYYVERYGEIEVEEFTFKLETIKGTNTLEVLGDYHNFLVEPNFETNEVLILDGETDEIIPVKYKNVPETTEGMRNLVVKFVFQILPKIMKKLMK